MPSVDELRKMLRDARKSEVPISKMKKADVEKKLAELGLLSAEVAVEVPVVEAVAEKPKKAAKAAKAPKEAPAEAPKVVKGAKAVNPPVQSSSGKGIVHLPKVIPSASQTLKKKVAKSE
jgi:hypothetical protein